MAGTEHVLLVAMTRQSEDSLARRLLDDVGATEALRSRIEDLIGPADEPRLHERPGTSLERFAALAR